MQRTVKKSAFLRQQIFRQRSKNGFSTARQPKAGLLLCSQQTLVKRKQRLVDFEDVVVLVLYKILDNDVKLI